jgi:ubiquinone/menaquinone biosynthesis C-methylase UbiE
MTEPPQGQARPPHTCPVWLGYLLANPLRRLVESPQKLVLPLVKSGDRVLELGPGLGFFTLSLAGAVGPSGKVVCVDVQPGMLDRLGRRLRKRGLAEHVERRLCSQDDLGLQGEHERCDLALAIHVVHETVLPAATLGALAACLRPGGQLLLVEAPGHVSREVWQAEVSALERAGLVRVPHPRAEGRKLLALWRKAGP